MLSRKKGVSDIGTIITVIVSHCISEVLHMMRTRVKVDNEIKTRHKKSNNGKRTKRLKSQKVGDKKRMAASASKNQEVKKKETLCDFSFFLVGVTPPFHVA